MPFMSKNLVNAQRKWTRLRNKYLKNRTETDKIYYNKQRIFGVNFLRKKKYYYRNLNEKNVIDNERFWKIVKSPLSAKAKSSEKRSRY